MRRIVQIGTGRQSWINFRDGDVFLGCEPMYNRITLFDAMPPLKISLPTQNHDRDKFSYMQHSPIRD